MPNRRPMTTKKEEAPRLPEPVRIPLSAEIARRGIHNDDDFAAVFTALIGDTLSGVVNPNVTNAACNSAGKVLKMVELRQKYGATAGSIRLADNGKDVDPRDRALAKLSDDERKLLGVG